MLQDLRNIQGVVFTGTPFRGAKSSKYKKVDLG